ncbi:MAG TPA: DUF222 domain-containing protein, partial [Nocardioidaceae bacterium]|nr:DUF222 domain-containing protein [Nocardioidaceae bacterium]
IVTAMLTCLESLQSIRGVSAGTLTAKEIRLMLLAVMQVTAAVFALRLRLLVAGEVQRVADLTGATSTAAFFAHLTQTRRADANAQAKLARDLDRRFPLLADALERGLMSPEHVQVAVAALRKLPKTVTTEKVARCQRFLVEAAQAFSPSDLRQLGRKLWQVIDPDGAERREGEALEDEEELAKAKAYFRSWRNGDGTTGFRGKLPDLHADIILKAIKALAAPRRRKNPNIPTGQPDDIRYPDSGSPAKGNTGGSEPGTSDGAGCGSNSDEGSGQDPQPVPPPGSDSTPGPGSRPDPGRTPGSPDDDGEEPPPEEPDVPYPVRLGHALMELLERLPQDALPRAGGTSARIRVTMRLDQLLTGLGTVTLDTGTIASAGQIRRLACQAGIIPVVLDGKSRPLDVGREQRFHTEAQREAMEVRDGGCVVDGCGRPALECEAHHGISWDDGGDTNVDDGFLVCPHHHHLLHRGWTVEWLPHGKARLRRIDRR